MFYKKGSALGVFFLIILIGILGFLVYYLVLNLPGESKDFMITDEIQEVDVGLRQGSVSEQFYQSMRYKNKRIGYVISDICDDSRSGSALEAFKIIEDLTVLEFYENELQPEINILCSDVAPEADHRDHFVAGEGGPTEIINSTVYSVILKGKVSLFREDTCGGSKVAVHELLHALGFNHNQNPGSILFPTLDCDQIIDDEITQDINRLYSRDGLPDLKISNVDASKAGRYLSFEIEVINQGLDDVGQVDLSIYDGGEFVQDFSLDEIELGAKKILNVENLKISRKSNEVSFVVDKNNVIPELSEGNNRVDLVLTAN